jgi:hypothetical protein
VRSFSFVSPWTMHPPAGRPAARCRTLGEESIAAAQEGDEAFQVFDVLLWRGRQPCHQTPGSGDPGSKAAHVVAGKPTTLKREAIRFHHGGGNAE